MASEGGGWVTCDLCLLEVGFCTKYIWRYWKLVLKEDSRSMAEEGNCESSPAGPSSTPAVVTTTPEPKLEMSSYMKQLMAEKQKLEEETGPDLQLAHRLLTTELERLQNGGRSLHSTSNGNRANNEDRRFADIIKEKPIKVTIRVLVPVKEHPKFNFVGKLLGPKGNSLKRLQEDTMTKMAILGRGSMRDKHKEEELRTSADPKYAHFNDDLHVEITAFAPPAEAHARIAYALAEVRKFLVPDYNDEIRQEQMREMQLLNTAVLGLSSPAADLVDTSSPTAQSPTTSPPPTSTSKTNSTGSNQNGRHMQAIPYTQQNGRNYLFGQQLLLHPAFRGLSARTQLPGVTSVFHSGGGGSILNRLRPHYHLAAPSGISTSNNRLSPGAVISPTKHQRNNILSILAGGPRSVIGGGLTTVDSVPSGGGNEQLLATMCGASDDVMVAAGEEDDMASAVYGLYDAAAAVASGTGYGLIETYANGNNVLAAENMEDITGPQDTVNGTASADLTTARSEGGAIKIDRARYRHDPYSRYTGVKLPL
ncbi:uncharacterized protein LOC110827939 isoform X2 [Zootermopsis nevadensis]|uniref:uncharacterized protein LOC110827939 isoform X2 n=1 Tax=Zootermopsis nevadensis TaxID=136037 RepID=UPI000B8EE483|nr:uncharacterized protein LOC110827939 isoform X2 [Zootermopsis nevadensis]